MLRIIVVLTFNNLVALKRTMADLCGLDLGPGSTGLDLSPGSAGERNTESHSVPQGLIHLIKTILSSKVFVLR